MIVAHLTSSPFFGGPEKQMLGLAQHLPAPFETKFLLFREGGRHSAFLEQIRAAGFEGIELGANTPHFRAMVCDVASQVKRHAIDVLCCAGYKADLVGGRAARRVGIPVVSVSHGWTAATWKVRIYETLDRIALRRMDQVVCVSAAQADKVLASGVSSSKVSVIRNAIRPEQFAEVDSAALTELQGGFVDRPAKIVGAAGRLSPEKGFNVLIEAVPHVLKSRPDVGFALFGDGPERAALTKRVTELGLERQVVFFGFRTDVGRFLPHFDVLALPSFTEGLPVVALEACVSAVPVVATAVGGTPEVIEDRVTGLLVPPGDPPALARGLLEALDGEAGQIFAQRARERVLNEFTFSQQASAYAELIERLVHRQGR